MSGVIHPVGPEKPKVYWVRRLLFLGAIISTLLLIIYSFRSPDSKAAVSSTQSPTPTESALSEVTTVTETLNATPSGTTSPSSSASPELNTSTEISTSTELSLCSDEQISLSVSIDPQNPKVSQSMKLTMRIVNTSTSACLRDVGSGVNEITIISGPALIWSTDHCNTSTATDVRTLVPNAPVSFTATWDGVQTSKGCVMRNQATAGTYWAHTRNASKNSDGVRFVLAD